MAESASAEKFSQQLSKTSWTELQQPSNSLTRRSSTQRTRKRQWRICFEKGRLGTEVEAQRRALLVVVFGGQVGDVLNQRELQVWRDGGDETPVEDAQLSVRRA
eukprot:13369-Pleurochrysis_carterae.AAC.1